MPTFAHGGAALPRLAAAGAGLEGQALPGTLCCPGRLREPRKGTAFCARKTAVAHFHHPLPSEMNVSLEARKEIYIKILLMF